MQYVKQSFAITTSSWTPFSPNVACNSIVFRNTTSVAVKIRTNSADATTEDTLQPNDQEILPSTARNVTAGSSNSYVFGTASIVGYWQLSTGTGQSMMASLFAE